MPVASGKVGDAVLTLDSGASTLWISSLVAGQSRPLPAAARLHVYLARGTVLVESVGRLEVGDALRLVGDTELMITAIRDAELLAWELGR